MSDKQKPFDALSVALKGSNLIEASAGTGKTYSIAVLVLRMIVEQGISIREILMVTFTKAAVAELEERVRLFTRRALRAVEGLEIADENIRGLVEHASAKYGEDLVRQRLQAAVLFLDESSIMTIHSFCQNVLNEFAFETKQLFGMELQANSEALIEDELNDFWRRRITTLPVALLQLLGGGGFKDWLFNRLKQHLTGKRYVLFNPDERYKLESEMIQSWESACLETDAQLNEQKVARTARFEANRKDLSQRLKGHRYESSFANVFVNAEVFFEALTNNYNKKYVQQAYTDWEEEVEANEVVIEQRSNLDEEMRRELTCYAIQECSQSLKQIMLRRNLMSYDDLISNLHKALVQQENPALVAALQQKYKAVFVDEFQDTDRLQYEIFERAFSQNTILFLIGDPKQSIYAWRKADVFTYLRARDSVDHLYGMNKSFRSSETLIAALNQFFLPTPDFDTFHFRSGASAIRFLPVESPEPNLKGFVWKDGKPDVPLSVCAKTDKGSKLDAVAAQVFELLASGRYELGPKEKKRAVRPSDIGVLVRKNSTGKEIQKVLGSLGIPSVCVDESRVLQSDEATMLYYLLEAIAGPSRSKINRALLTSFTAFNASDLLLLDEEAVLEKFLNYQDIWQNQGVYAAIMAFAGEFGVRAFLLEGGAEGGQRMLTNLYQISEILHGIQTRKDLSMTELIAWLQRAVTDSSLEGDEYEQRVESDEEAVRIVTIHKSKGLEYPIVLAPELNLSAKLHQGADLFSFRDPNTSEYFFVDKKLASADQLAWREEQEEQENRRLLYVALTRAVFKCFVFPSDNRSAGTTLPHFLSALSTADADLIETEVALLPLPRSRYSSTRAEVPAGLSLPVADKLINKNWGRMSFSGMKAERTSVPRIAFTGMDEGYEHFVMRDLNRGPKTGDMLHFILERATFDDDANWDGVLEGALHRYAPSKREAWKPMLEQMLEFVFSARIVLGDQGFSLKQVNWNRRIPEFGFDFPVTAFNSARLESLSDQLAPLKLKYGRAGVRLEGIMNGKIDLFFEHDGRYYILDWKSNYLGPTPEYYSRERIKEAMDEEGYHLQYLIYSVAARKYLEQRIPGFDYDKQFGGVIYLFLRGLRPGQDSGIFTEKPSREKMDALGKVLSGGLST